MTLQSDFAASQTSSESEAAEQRMRRALGLDRPATSPAPGRRTQSDQQTMSDHGHHQAKRRFVRDGEVPVVVLNARLDARGKEQPSGSRFEIAEAALRVEQEARESAERSLAEALVQIHELKTNLGHALLSADEARAALRHLQTQRQEEFASHQASLAALARPDRAERSSPKPQPEMKRKLAAVAKAKLPRKAASKPVKWWIKAKSTN